MMIPLRVEGRGETGLFNPDTCVNRATHDTAITMNMQSQQYDTELAAIDDADHLAYVLTRRAKAAREMSVAGVLASIAHPAAYEHRSPFDIVIDPGCIDILVKRANPDHADIISKIEPELRAWLVGDDLGKRERARYVLARLLGPDSDIIENGLAAPKKGLARALRATLLGIKDAGFARLPAKLAPLLRKLLRTKELTRIEKELDDPGDVCALVVGALAHIDSPEAHAVLRDAFEGDDVDLIMMALPHVFAKLDPAMVRARFDRCIATIAASRQAGLPDRRAIALGGALAHGVGSDAVMAKQAVTVLDLIPGPAKTRGQVDSFAQLIANSVDALDSAELERVAVQMTLPPEERLVATAVAWIRLPIERAKALAAKFKEGDRATQERRWLAVARAHLAWPSRRPEIQALIPLKYLVLAIEYDPKAAPPDVASQVLVAAMREARNPAELLVAVRAGSVRGEYGVMRPLLVRFRDAPFKIDAELEALLPRLMGPDDEGWIEQEIDGENPYRDRCEALDRALRKARSLREK